MAVPGQHPSQFLARLGHYASMAWALGKHRVHQLRHGDQAFFRILSTNPPVLLLAHHDKDFLPLHRAIGKGPGYFLFNFWGTKESARALEAIRRLERRKNLEFPQHRYIYLCNSEAELGLLGQVGLQGIFCNHNCWVDESLFRPDPDRPKRFAAVYDANLAPYKRHALAAQVEDLALISFRHPVLLNRPYAATVRRSLPQATWLNDPMGPDFRYLTAAEVATTLQQSRVGLCLSASEGAMYASIQYLLCGLPVVSTASKGGRDAFFEDEYTLIVEDSPEAVRDGVREMIARNLDPYRIRARTLEKVAAHRDRFVDLLQDIFDHAGADRAARGEWPRLFCHKMGLDSQSIRQGARQLGAGQRSPAASTL